MTDSTVTQSPQEPQAKKYRVYVYIRGIICSPGYEGRVDVWSTSMDQASEDAKRKLKRSGVWFDRTYSDFVVRSIEEAK